MADELALCNHPGDSSPTILIESEFRGFVRDPGVGNCALVIQAACKEHVSRGNAKPLAGITE